MNKQILNHIDIETLFKCLPKGDFIFQNENEEWVLVPKCSTLNLAKGFFDKSFRELIYDYIEYLKNTRPDTYYDVMINLLTHVTDDCLTKINNFKNKNSKL